MNVTRLDLDGTGSPLGLVTKILAVEPDLPIPVPIEALAANLDITEIAELTTEGFEGGLLTDEVRSFGGILVRRGMGRQRRRFTIGHELGHFLILTHQPAKPGQFLCTVKDMRQWSTMEQNRAARMEVEANRFSAAILMPPPHLKRFMAKMGDPDISQVLAVHEHFDVSKETAARAYATHHAESVAIAVVHEQKILRIYRSIHFPKMCVAAGAPLPGLANSIAGFAAGTLTQLRIAQAGRWLESDWGVKLPALYEQVLVQSDSFAMVLLWAESASYDDDYDPDADKTAKERFRDRTASFDPFDRRG